MSQTIAEKTAAKFIDNIGNPFEDKPERPDLDDLLSTARVALERSRNRQKKQLAVAIQEALDGVRCKALAVIREERQPTDAHARCCLHTLTRVENAVENELTET